MTVDKDQFTIVRGFTVKRLSEVNKNGLAIKNPRPERANIANWPSEYLSFGVEALQSEWERYALRRAKEKKGLPVVGKIIVTAENFSLFQNKIIMVILNLNPYSTSMGNEYANLQPAQSFEQLTQFSGNEFAVHPSLLAPPLLDHFQTEIGTYQGDKFLYRPFLEFSQSIEGEKGSFWENFLRRL